MNTGKNDGESGRLSDFILNALEEALNQKDRMIAAMLANALEIALTRGAGGRDFVERRDYPPRIESALNKLNQLDSKKAV